MSSSVWIFEVIVHAQCLRMRLRGHAYAQGLNMRILADFKVATKCISNNYKFPENNIIHWPFFHWPFFHWYTDHFSMICCLLSLSLPEFRPLCFVYFLLYRFFLIVDEDQLSFHLRRNGRLSSSNHRVHNQEINSRGSCWKHYRQEHNHYFNFNGIRMLKVCLTTSTLQTLGRIVSHAWFQFKISANKQYILDFI